MKLQLVLAQPNISTKELAKFEIPLPTLDEQKAIVAKLDRAQRLIEIDKEMLAKYDELIQSVFLEMFGDSGYESEGVGG
ncbi:MAG: restriction endonuclease subunit S [Melioribacteraceae bacterium]|nr:restriction endonuclease subunit S [Melioribacteraceae bacterium]